MGALSIRADGNPLRAYRVLECIVNALTVSEKDLREFELAVVTACVKQSPNRLEYMATDNPVANSLNLPTYLTAVDGSLVISFDAGWYPFLCNTRGYNTGPQRWYIPKISRLIAHVARALQTPIQRRVSYMSGGRIFLDAAGVRRRPQGHEEIVVLGWTLPRESPLLPPRF